MLVIPRVGLQCGLYQNDQGLVKLQLPGSPPGLNK